MSIPSAVKSTPIGSRQQLTDYLAAGEKPRDAWRIGTEHEKFGFLTDTLRPPTFDGDRGIRVLLETLATRYGWEVARVHGAQLSILDGSTGQGTRMRIDFPASS